MSVADYFLKIDGIDGESQDSKHKNEIELLAYTFGAQQSGTAAIAAGWVRGRSVSTIFKS